MIETNLIAEILQTGLVGPDLSTSCIYARKRGSAFVTAMTRQSSILACRWYDCAC